MNTTSLDPQDFLMRVVNYTNIDKSNRPECLPTLYSTWNCCEFHRSLKPQHDALEVESRQYQVTSNGDFRSAKWFTDFCRKYALRMPLNTVSWMTIQLPPDVLAL